MDGMTERTALLLGEDGVERLKKAHVLLFGLGGVGSYAAEALARAGVGSLTLVDDDTVSESNLNRQLVALHSTLGQNKAQVAAARIRDINPDCNVTVAPVFYMPATSNELPFDGPVHYDYIVDAIDTVTGKIALVMNAKAAKTPIICSMGAGNKVDPTAFEVTDLYKTSVCPLAKVMRNELKKRGVRKLKVVYSKELPITPVDDMAISCRTHCICPPGTERKCTQRRQVPGSNAFVPSVVGLIIAGEVIKDLTGFKGRGIGA